MAATDSDTQPSGTTPGGIVGFLLARIAEDEGVAKEALRRYQHVLGINHYFAANQGSSVAMTPRAALAECQAKRAIVEEHPAETKWMLYGVDGDETYCAAESDPDGTMAAGQPFPCPTIRHLAVIYASHPDYQPEWRP